MLRVCTAETKVVLMRLYVRINKDFSIPECHICRNRTTKRRVKTKLRTAKDNFLSHLRTYDSEI